MSRDDVYNLIHQNLCYSPNTEKIRWIMDANGWNTAEDVRDHATDNQIEAIPVVWGLEAYAC